ncbi:hypothetical protein TNCT_374901 [Trichonephila clavata]|uniref:Uncharacterized protein n=1 Tax=Trichonephila clavata TaxID=2740835 RepID=A0A8X6EZY2_TRICU|nr:hypothetical protein TNCT_374901 [Trichonephila clavata]
MARERKMKICFYSRKAQVSAVQHVPPQGEAGMQLPWQPGAHRLCHQGHRYSHMLSSPSTKRNPRYWESLQAIAAPGSLSNKVSQLNKRRRNSKEVAISGVEFL